MPVQIEIMEPVIRCGGGLEASNFSRAAGDHEMYDSDSAMGHGRVGVAVGQIESDAEHPADGCNEIVRNRCGSASSRFHTLISP